MRKITRKLNYRALEHAITRRKLDDWPMPVDRYIKRMLERSR